MTIQINDYEYYGNMEKQNQMKKARAGGVAQVLEHLPNKCKALGSKRSTAKKKDKLTISTLYAHIFKD
jgi:hypothetical protein